MTLTVTFLLRLRESEQSWLPRGGVGRLSGSEPPSLQGCRPDGSLARLWSMEASVK